MSAAIDRGYILAEIKRVANKVDGKPPRKGTFEREGGRCLPTLSVHVRLWAASHDHKAALTRPQSEWG